MERLEAAMQAYLAWKSAGGVEPEAELLRRHPSLRELLLPLLHEQPAEHRQLGDFELVRELGRGGMGIVYEAIQVSLQRRVALKVLPAHLTLRPSSIARFQREATIAARLQHDGIVKIHTVGTTGDAHWLAMDLVDGVPLDHRCVELGDERRIPILVGLVIQVAEALAYAHARGVIHRDVKPANILVTRAGKALLTDFGLAREEDLPSLSLTGEFAGTPHYASPEQAQSRSAAIDHRTDLFSLGATLYEVLTKRRAFDGETTQAVLSKILTKEPADPQRVNPELPADLAAITLKALEKDPRRRYQSAQEFADDLRAFLSYRPVRARRASASARLWRAVRREPLKATLALVLVLGVPALAGMFGYVQAKRSAIAVGETTLQQRELERLLAEGFLQWEWQDYAVARQRFEAALQLDLHQPEALAGLASTLSLTGAPEQALALLARDDAVARVPALRRLQAGALQKLGRTQEAEAARAQVPEPEEPFALFLTGLAELEAQPKNQANAARALEQLTAATLRSPAPRLVYYGLRAKAAARANDPATARQVVDAMARLWPDVPATWWWSGMAMNVIDPERALAAFERALAAHPNPALARTNVAVAQFNAGRHRETIANARLALELDPALAGAHFISGKAWQELNDHAAAAKAFRRAVELAPEDLRASYNLGLELMRLDELPPAAAAYRTALAGDRGYHDARANLSVVLLRLEQFEEAERVLREGIAVAPQHPGFHQNLVAVLDARDDQRGVRDELVRWVGLNPGDHEAWHDLAHQHFDAGARADAVACAERALALLPAGDPKTAELRREIEGCLAEFRGR